MTVKLRKVLIEADNGLPTLDIPQAKMMLVVSNFLRKFLKTYQKLSIGQVYDVVFAPVKTEHGEGKTLSFTESDDVSFVKVRVSVVSPDNDRISHAINAEVILKDGGTSQSVQRRNNTSFKRRFVATTEDDVSITQIVNELKKKIANVQEQVLLNQRSSSYNEKNKSVYDFGSPAVEKQTLETARETR